MKPRKFQIQKSDEGVGILKQYGLVYFSMQERTGKTLTSILCAEKFGAKRVLVVTKKKALPDFKETLEAYSPSFEWVATNYHQVHKVEGEFDLVIVDEAHSYVSGFPDRGSLWSALRSVTEKKPIIYLSATPHAQGYQLLFNQLALSDFSPWKQYGDPLDWFADYGFPDSFKKTVHKGGRSFEIEIPVYKNLKTRKIEGEIEKYFVTGTREELGFAHEPEDIVHYVELEPLTKEIYNSAVLYEKVQLPDGMRDLSEKSAMRSFLHQFEGGVGKDYKEVLSVKAFLHKDGDEIILTLKQGAKLNTKTTIQTNRGEYIIPVGENSVSHVISRKSIKIESVFSPEFDEVSFPKGAISLSKSKHPDEINVKNSIKDVYIEFFNCEKINYILNHFGDNENLVIMYHFKAEEKKLSRFFKKATLLQGTSFAEGVDLSMYDHLVIYSQDYSTSRHTQRRARQANFQRETPIQVHFLLVRGALSEDVYRSVSINKENFVDSRFKKRVLR